MLVLLIIFIVTLPVINHSVKIDLPRANSVALEPEPQAIRLSIDAQGQYFWNEQPLRSEDLEPRLRAEGARSPQPELHIQGDQAARYDAVAQALAAAQRASLRKIGFVTEPGSR
jgi:biopolymer transport protein ExbD